MSLTYPESLFEEHKGMALKIGRSFHLNGYGINESEQEALIALWKAATLYDQNKGAFEPFASTVIRNNLRNAFEKAKRTSVEVTILDGTIDHQNEDLLKSIRDSSISSTEASPLLEAERNDIRIALKDGLASLTPAQQEVLKLYSQGMSYSEIARDKGVSKAAVRQMVQRAANQIRPEILSRGVSGIAFMPAADNCPRLEEPRDYDFSQFDKLPSSRKGVRPIFLIVVIFVLIVLGISKLVSFLVF
jgi:RNA polymerase sigma factor (sigma-70 family)